MLQARMKNPAFVVPDAMQPLLAVGGAAKKAGVPERTLNLVYLRASQINGCTFCMDMHTREAKKAGETDERLFTVAGFREAPFFSDAERAALALTEAATRMSDRENPVSDEVWQAASQHYDEVQLAALVLNIGMINLWNRLNVTTRQIAGTPWR
ncbi:MAG: carboxymuconolactone decarboxylase family protein [Myxococcales bacterium]